MTALLEASLRTPVRFLVPAGVLAQAFRDGARQARLAKFLKTPAVQVIPLTEVRARAAGALCGQARTRDVIDASVVIAAREHQAAIVTGDPAGLARLDPLVQLHAL
jgi:hypothetical protein